MFLPQRRHDSLDIVKQLELVRDFWDVFDATGESGQTTRETLERIRSRVNDCYYRGASGLYEAISLTAEAMLLMSGGST